MSSQQKVIMATLATAVSAVKVQSESQCDLAIGPGMILDLTVIPTECCAYAAGFFLPGAYDNPQAAPMLGDGCLLQEELWPFYPEEYYNAEGEIVPTQTADGSPCDPNADPADRPFAGIDMYSAYQLCCVEGCQAAMLNGMAAGSGMLNGMIQPSMFDADGDTIIDFCPDLECGPSVPEHCLNGVADETETDVDCGGADCAQCDAGKICAAASDCTSGMCTDITCVTASPTPTPPTFEPTANPTATPTTADPTAAPTPAPPTADPTMSPTGVSGASSVSAVTGACIMAGAVAANMM